MSNSKKLKYNPFVWAYILEGSLADKLELNPYSPKSQIKKFHAWSAGRFDKWGRV